MKIKQIEWDETGRKGCVTNFSNIWFLNSVEDEGGVISVSYKERYFGFVEYNAGEDFKVVAQNWLNNHVIGLLEDAK